ncbi:MAG: ABC-2 type transport system permease protein [Pseudohongiellaceae bacterium]|jgi:ABC-2 type transport system permease protein
MTEVSSVGLLRGAAVVAARELGNYFDSKIAYVYTIAFVVLANSIFMNEFFLTGTVDMTGFFDLMPLLLPVFLPAVTMRLWAEERKQRTIEMLLTMPIRPIQAVLGKYMAALLLFGLFLLGSLPIVFMLCALGEPDLGLIAGGYLGLIGFGAMFLALGMFLSSLSSDQIVAFISTTAVGFVFVLSGNDRVVAVLDGLFPALSLGTGLYESFSVMPHYDGFVRGVVSLPSVLYFAGLSALFLWVNATVLERYRG